MVVFECFHPSMKFIWPIKSCCSKYKSSLLETRPDVSVENRVANRPEFFGTVPNSPVSRVPNGSIRDRLMSRIFTAQTVMSTRILISGF